MIFKTEKIKNILKPNKLISLFILSLIVWQAALLPLTTEAQEITGNAKYDALEESLGNIGCYFSVKCWVERGMAWTGYRILQISTVALWIGAELFNVSSDISLGYGSYSGKGGAVAVYKGWILTRDFVNLFFIFAILIIAIATILQISQYGAKQLLLKLVLIALFINFSFFITQQIIIATNSAALYFYNPVKTAGLPTIFSNGLDPQKLIGGYKLNPDKIREINSRKSADEFTDEELLMLGQIWKLAPCLGVTSFGGGIDKEKCIEKAREGIKRKREQNLPAAKEALIMNNTTYNANILSIIITTIGGVIVVLTAAFILLAAAVLFMIRTVILWVLMVLAPLAFFAYILPETRKHWSAWWNRLLKEAFFAPAMMFMFFIVVLIINSGFLETYVVQGNTSKTGDSFVFNYYLVAQYVFLLLLLVISLTVARNMGATGASMAIDYGTRARKWAQGKAGRVPARFARRYTAPVAEKIATGEGRVAKTLRRIPGIGAGARALVGSERQRVSDMEKQLGSMTTDEIKAKYEAKWFKNREDLMAMTNVLKSRGDLGKLSTAQLKEVHGRMKGLGMDVKDIETYSPLLAATKEDKRKAVQRWRSDTIKDMAKNKETFQDKEMQSILREELNDEEFRALYEASKTGGDAKDSFEAFQKSLVEQFGGNIDNIADALEEKGNFRLAKLMRSQEGYVIMKDYVEEPSRYVAAEQAKANLTLPNQELGKKIAVMSEPTASKQDRNVLKETIQALNFERFTDILDELAHTEKQQLALTMKQQDSKQLERILNYNPSLLETTTKDERGNDIKFAEKLNYKGIKSAADYIRQMPTKNAGQISNEELTKEEVIKSLSKHQWSKIAEAGNITGEITEAIKKNWNKLSDDLRNYFTSNMSWELKVAPKKSKLKPEEFIL